MTSVKRKQINLSMEQKLGALKRLDKGESVNAVALDLGVGRSTIGDWKKKRADIESWCLKRVCTDSLKERKNMKESEFLEVSEALYLWFRQQREKGTPMSGPILQEKALQLYEKLKKDSEITFGASIGWLDRWKKRYGVRQLSVCGEKLSGNDESVLKFKDSFHKFIESEGLTGDQIYNCDETGLNFRMLPEKSLASKEEKSVPGHKRSKERVTVMACCNATGEHKLKLCLIGKSKKPRAFKHVNVNELPVWYKNQSNAWMDRAIFKDWFYTQFVPSVEMFLKSKNLPRKAVLILDNASSHPDAEEMIDGDIKIMFLPPNVTALCQPMDQGVLAAIKKRYRRKLLSSIVTGIDEGQDLITRLKKLDLLDVIGWVSASWDELEQITLVRSWKKLLDHSGNSFTSVPAEEDSALVALVKKVPGCEDFSDADVGEWMRQDDNERLLSDDEIVTIVLEEKHEETDSESEDPINNEEQHKMSHSEGLKAVEGALQYFEQQGASPMDILFLRRLRDEAAKKRAQCEKQTSIVNFFVKK